VGAAGQAGIGPTAADDFEAMLTQYPTWQAATAEPVNVSGYIWGLCRLPTPAEEDFAESEHGQERYIREWDNALALSVLDTENDSEFPVGAAIAKEKWAVQPGSSQKTLVGVGMMIRRADGFDSVAGDWQFAYWEDGKGIRYDQEQSRYCAECHSSAPDGDFVFRKNWRFPVQ
jgi:hypothetical protein